MALFPECITGNRHADCEEHRGFGVVCDCWCHLERQLAMAGRYQIVTEQGLDNLLRQEDLGPRTTHAQPEETE